MTIDIRSLWRAVRHLTTDDAYERYLEHHRLHHAGSPPLDERSFYLDEQRRKWTGVQRCC
jgi:uncharacterized short protein YbdD (DUF466 family)